MDCGAVRLQGRHCLAHLTDSEWTQEITRLREGGDLDARGVAISAERLQGLLDALRPDEKSSPLVPASDFRGARFADEADFAGVQFSATANFGEARFVGRANFAKARFSGEADFKDAAFFEGVIFSEAEFIDDTLFKGVLFAGFTNFSGAQFSGKADFETTWFYDSAFFSHAHFAGDATLNGAQFYTEASFIEAQFSGHAACDEMQCCALADFSWAQFSEGASFDEGDFRNIRFYGAQFCSDATFERTHVSQAAAFTRCIFRWHVTLGPLGGSGILNLDGAYFQEGVRLEASLSRFSCKGARFAGRTDLNVRWAEIALDDAVFIRPSRLAGVSPLAGIDDTQAQMCHLDRRLDADPRPRLLSLRQANVENLALGNVDLSACRFSGAHGLDKLRIEADCKFAQPPSSWRYTRRQTLAEEQHWRRSAALPDCDWYPPECRSAHWLMPEPEALDPPRIASVYRALREALEDRKDEPGAADFYYGEMEMRRHESDIATRALVTLYWLVSGYALRATRALLALALTVALAAAVLSRWGFHPSGPYRGYGRSLLFALESSISLLRAPSASLSAGGQITEIILRVAGPLFFGLALLSIRGRVKR